MLLLFKAQLGCAAELLLGTSSMLIITMQCLTMQFISTGKSLDRFMYNTLFYYKMYLSTYCVLSLGHICLSVSKLYF